MSGLRIHCTLGARNCTITVPHPRKPYTIVLDNDGDAIVSATIWQRLEEARALGTNHGLVFVNEVANPPTQYIGVAQELAPEGTVARIVRNT